jgi:primary-amine oxidase
MRLAFWLLAGSLLLLGNLGARSASKGEFKVALQERLNDAKRGDRPDQNEDPRRTNQKTSTIAGVKIQGNQILASFPTSAATPETAWKINWRVDKRHGLVIEQAWFLREGDWLKVLGDSRVAEIHVPYYNSKTYYFDMSGNSTKTVPVSDELAGPGKNLKNQAVLELRESGIQWMKMEKKETPRIRRGEEIVLWAPLQAGWYLYLVEYRFRDDGSISFRAGSTGSNSPDEPHVTHMHNTIWRLDVDLGKPDAKGFVRNSARWLSHKEPALGQRVKQDSVIETLFNNGVEGGSEWRPEEFHRLRIVNEVEKNQQGNPISYEMVPMRTGSARHYQPQEAFSGKDVWVTPYVGQKPDGEPLELSVIQLPEVTQKGRRIENEDIVIWYLASALHVPRDEDMLSRNRPGATMTVWSGFEMRPRNLFSATPLYDRKLSSKQVQPGR